MNKEINWENFNVVSAIARNGICVGEERTLKEEEIVALNMALARARLNMEEAAKYLDEARRRFKAR